MTNTIIPFNFDGRAVRALMDAQGTPWFVAKDVCAILGYSNASKAIADHVDDDDKLNNESLSSLGQRGGWLINESGLYSLILSSKMPNAREFRRWITSEVLPSIRKHGAYMTEQVIERTLTDPDYLIQLATTLKEERAKRLEAERTLEDQKPKVLWAKAVETSGKDILIGELAKILKQNGVETGQRRLFEWLRDNGFLMKRNGIKNMPTQKSMEAGLFRIVEKPFNHPDGHTDISFTTKVTPKGQEYFINKFLNGAEQ